MNKSEQENTEKVRQGKKKVKKSVKSSKDVFYRGL